MYLLWRHYLCLAFDSHRWHPFHPLPPPRHDYPSLHCRRFQLKKEQWSQYASWNWIWFNGNGSDSKIQFIMLLISIRETQPCGYLLRHFHCKWTSEFEHHWVDNYLHRLCLDRVRLAALCQMETGHVQSVEWISTVRRKQITMALVRALDLPLWFELILWIFCKTFHWIPIKFIYECASFSSCEIRDFIKFKSHKFSIEFNHKALQTKNYKANNSDWSLPMQHAPFRFHVILILHHMVYQRLCKCYFQPLAWVTGKMESSTLFWVFFYQITAFSYFDGFTRCTMTLLCFSQ